MNEKCYKVEFTAHLHKLTLALKLNCQIQIIWKRGQKTCESGKFILQSGTANFNDKISINCNMLFDSKTKIFKQKITKFAIILLSDRGTKQAGEILFDVASYLSQKQLHKKDYELKLDKCPDKNAKLTLTLSGVMLSEVSADSISQKSYSQSLLNSKIKDNNIMEGITNSMIVPNTKNSQKKQKQAPKEQKQSSSEINKDSNKSPGNHEEKLQQLEHVEQENKKLKDQIKKMQKLKKQNEELRKKIKNQDFKKVAEIKNKMEKLKEESQKMKSQIKANRSIVDQTKTIQGEILVCKIKIMKALNFCAQYGGGELMDSVQQYCGMLQK